MVGIHRLNRFEKLRLLLQVSRRLLQVDIAFLVRATGSKTSSDEGRPRPALEEKDREDDAETEAEGGLDEEVREAAIPL